MPEDGERFLSEEIANWITADIHERHADGEMVQIPVGLEAEIENDRLTMVELAVAVGDANIIQIDQRYFSYAASRESFHRPGAHSSKADDGYVRPAKARKGILPIESRKSGKAIKISL